MSLNYYKTKTDQKRKWCISPSSLGLSAKNAILIQEMVVIENVVVALENEYDLGNIMIWVSITNVSLVNFDMTVKDWPSSQVSNQNLTSSPVKLRSAI